MNVSILHMCNYSNKEIMEITGHKSVQSLTIYQCVRPQKMIDMGKTLSTALTNSNENVMQVEHAKKSLPAPPQKATEPAPPAPVENVDDAIVPFEPNLQNDGDADFDTGFPV